MLAAAAGTVENIDGLGVAWSVGDKHLDAVPIQICGAQLRTTGSVLNPDDKAQVRRVVLQGDAGGFSGPTLNAAGGIRDVDVSEIEVLEAVCTERQKFRSPLHQATGAST